MPFADIGIGRVAYDSRGDGPVVVLSHASLVDRRMWRAQLEAIGEHFRVITWDRLGYGDSDPAPPSVRHGADLLRLMDALGIARAALVGSSMGGGYSLDAALSAPDRVTALALICPGVPGYVWPDEMLAEFEPPMYAGCRASGSPDTPHTPPAPCSIRISPRWPSGSSGT